MSNTYPKLLDHNQKTLNDIESYISEGASCCVVNPCGSGKTSVMASFIKNHEDNTFLVLTKQKNAGKYYRRSDSIFSKDNVSIRTYNKMHSDVKKGHVQDYKADFYLVDEAHYLGANEWRESFKTLVDTWNPLLIGLTATPQRFEDQGTDHSIVHDFFDGNNAGNFTVKELERKGVFVEPEYVLSIYNMDTLIDDQYEKIAQSDIDDKRKESYYGKLNELNKEWEKNGKPSVVLRRYLPNYMYREKCNRILVYMSSVKDVKDKHEEVTRMISEVFPEKSVKQYIYTYKSSESELRKYLEEDDADIKILYSVDKIMETIHIEDLRICIMLRPSVSHRIITQQFGRINSIGNRNKPLIIDMVGNLEKLQEDTPYKYFSNTQGDNGERKEETSDARIKLPYIRKALSIFDTIERATRKAGRYTYKEYTGSLNDICFIHRRDPEEVRELLETHDLEDAIEMAKPKKLNMRQDMLDGINPIPEFTMTDEQKELAGKKIRLYNNFIKRNDIRDEDLCQDLYIIYCYEITKYRETQGYTLTMSIISRMNAYYVRALRRKAVQSDLTCRYDETNIGSYTNAGYGNSIAIEWLLENSELSEREKMVVKKYYGFEDGCKYTYRELGEELGICGNRVREIIMKSIRKMRTRKRNVL